VCVEWRGIFFDCGFSLWVSAEAVCGWGFGAVDGGWWWVCGEGGFGWDGWWFQGVGVRALGVGLWLAVVEEVCSRWG